MVQGLGFRVYNNLVNYFNKKLNKVTKHFSKCYRILRVLGLGFRV